MLLTRRRNSLRYTTSDSESDSGDERDYKHSSAALCSPQDYSQRNIEGGNGFVQREAVEESAPAAAVKQPRPSSASSADTRAYERAGSCGSSPDGLVTPWRSDGMTYGTRRSHERDQVGLGHFQGADGFPARAASGLTMWSRLNWLQSPADFILPVRAEAQDSAFSNAAYSPIETHCFALSRFASSPGRLTIQCQALWIRLAICTLLQFLSEYMRPFAEGPESGTLKNQLAFRLDMLEQDSKRQWFAMKESEGSDPSLFQPQAPRI